MLKMPEVSGAVSAFSGAPNAVCMIFITVDLREGTDPLYQTAASNKSSASEKRWLIMSQRTGLLHLPCRKTSDEAIRKKAEITVYKYVNAAVWEPPR